MTPDDVRRIAALPNPVFRNLEITQAYARLSAAMTRRTGQGANWCTFATWASRQAGRTIRGEDLLEFLQHRLGREGELLHPFASLGRWLLRRGLFQPETPLGRLTARLHTPFDAFELASDAVARGNLKVFAEIGLEFARYLADEPVDSAPLRGVFARYEEARAEQDPKRRTELVLLANLEIGLHEQTRLQPEIREALDAPYLTYEELGARLGCRRPRSARAAGRLAAPLQHVLSEISREAITHSFMVLSLPGRILMLGSHLDDPYPEALRTLIDADLAQLVGRYEPVPPAVDDCGAHDWSELGQRMHYIVHLFRAFHASQDLLGAPFTPDQMEQIAAGVLPEGEL